MKKAILIILIGLLVLPTVFAISMFSLPSDNIEVTQKDLDGIDNIQGTLDDWSVIDDGAKGNVLLSYRVKRNVVFPRAKAILKNAEPYTDYTLIYYGFGEHNDVWNHATCITSGRTNRNGNVRMRTQPFDYIPFYYDDIAQKFWIVTSSDVDCENNQMTAWNPSEYLFETRTV